MQRLRHIFGCVVLVLGGLLIGFVAATVTPRSWALSGALNGAVSAPEPWIFAIPGGTTTGNYPAGVITPTPMNTAANLLANQVHCLPYVAPKQASLTIKWQIEGSGTGSRCAVAAYNADTPANLLVPTTKLYGDVVDNDCGTIGTLQSVTGATITSGQLYWMCVWASVNTPMGMIAIAARTVNILGYDASLFPFAPRSAYQVNVTYPGTWTATSWPASFSTLGTINAVNNVNEPVLLMSLG